MNNFNFKKKFGQNFLVDNNIISKIVEGSCVDKDTLVIEIGPGSGAISKYIIPKSGYSILYEIDENLRDILKEELCFDNYKIIFGDFLKADIKNDICSFDFQKLYVVANLPYYITTPIIQKFIDDDVLPNKLVVMVQKEVAQRFCALPNTREYGSLTVLLNSFYDIYKLCDVSRNCFVPSPNVDSAVVVLNLKSKIDDVLDKDFFRKFVRDCFQYKRKNLRNNLNGYDLFLIETVLKKYNLSLNCRAEQLHLNVFVDLSNELCRLIVK